VLEAASCRFHRRALNHVSDQYLTDSSSVKCSFGVKCSPGMLKKVNIRRYNPGFQLIDQNSDTNKYEVKLFWEKKPFPSFHASSLGLY